MKESGYFTQELSLEVASLSIVTIQLLVLLQVVACLAFEILFAKVLDFFNMWVFVRTTVARALLFWLAFRAIEFLDQRRQVKTKLSSQKAAFCMRRTQVNRIPSLHTFR